MSESRTRKPKVSRGNLLSSLLLIILIVVCIVPLVYMAGNSFKTTLEYMASKFVLSGSFRTLAANFDVLVQAGILRSLANSVIAVTITVLLDIVFASMAGFFFSKLRFPGKQLIFWTIIGLMAIPAQVFIIPIYVLFANLNIINSVYSLSVLYATLGFPFGSFLLTSFYKRIPDEIVDSAKIDGAGNARVFLSIMFPLGKPAILTLSTIFFFSTWNELFIGFILNRTDASRLITPLIALFNEDLRTSGVAKISWPIIFTGSIVSLIVPLIVYVFTQNRIVEGLTAGALKE
jgi:ABC-type glycerol-3-phosphate transport system permease component